MPVLTLTQEEYIDGVVGVWKAELEEAGFTNRKPETPVLKGEWFSLADTVPAEESKVHSKLTGA